MIKLLIVLLTLFYPASLTAQEEDIFLDEQFTSLERWEPLYFSKIKEHSSYSLSTLDGKPCLVAESSNSASAIQLKEHFNVYTYPNVTWRWKISNVYKKGDCRRKDGDDYPVRLFVIFQYESGKASFAEKIKYELAYLMYGEYPPHSSLNYIWANKKQTASFIPSTYSDLAMMIPVVAGPGKVGEWTEHKINVVQDYRAAFGEDPPSMATIAIMSDSDNTGESARAYVDFVRVER